MSSSVGTTFSIAAVTTCTRGSVLVRSPLPSLVTMTLDPVSATRKFAPVIPTSALWNFSRSTARASPTSAAASVWRSVRPYFA